VERRKLLSLKGRKTRRTMKPHTPLIDEMMETIPVTEEDRPRYILMDQQQWYRYMRELEEYRKYIPYPASFRGIPVHEMPGLEARTGDRWVLPQ
jgi:hypothetical protein